MTNEVKLICQLIWSYFWGRRLIIENIPLKETFNLLSCSYHTDGSSCTELKASQHSISQTMSGTPTLDLVAETIVATEPKT